MRVKQNFSSAIVGSLLLLAASTGELLADDDASNGVEFSGSGFVSIVAGKVLNGTHDETTDLGYRCPCFIADYAQGGVYEQGRWRFAPDSKLGLQGQVAIDAGRYSVTAQVVARGARGGDPDLEWLYGTAELSGAWTLQVGRKRLPLFLASEVQDVGYALPWVHLPPQLYGWEVVNYNGASLTHRAAVGAWLAALQVIAGGETVRDSGFWKIYNGKDSRTDVRWSNILGGEMKLSLDGFDARVVYLQSDTQNRLVSDGATEFSPPARQKIHGLSFNVDDTRWVARAEFLYINREHDYGFDHAQLVALNYRVGSLLPLLSYSNYRQTVITGDDAPEVHSTRSVVLRYEWDKASAVKMQYDAWRDKSGAGYPSMHGDARPISLSYDRVF